MKAPHHFSRLSNKTTTKALKGSSGKATRKEHAVTQLDVSAQYHSESSQEAKQWKKLACLQTATKRRKQLEQSMSSFRAASFSEECGSLNFRAL